MRTAIKVTDVIICASGTLMPSRKPARAAGMTPVSQVQHMNSVSLKLHRARRSGSAHRKTVGRTITMKIATRTTPPCQYRFPSTMPKTKTDVKPLACKSSAAK